MTFLAIVNCYNTRMCLHIAITEIAAPISKDVTSHDCPGEVDGGEVEVHILGNKLYILSV